MIETKVVKYKNEKQMQKGMRDEQAKGWIVFSTASLDGGRSAVKTVGLGLIFLPLALLGKRKSAFLVTYQRDTEIYPQKEQPKDKHFKWGIIVLLCVVLILFLSLCVITMAEPTEVGTLPATEPKPELVIQLTVITPVPTITTTEEITLVRESGPSGIATQLYGLNNPEGE